MEYNSRILECLCKAGKGQSGTSTLPLELPTSEQIWKSPIGEANPFPPNRGFQHWQVGCIFVPDGGLLFSPPTNPGSQTLGKVDLEDIFSGVVSTELGPSLVYNKIVQREYSQKDSLSLQNFSHNGHFPSQYEYKMYCYLLPSRM